MTREPLCAKGERLSIPYGWLEMNFSDEQVTFLTDDERTMLATRLEKVNSSKWCFAHWIELLELIEELMEGHEGKDCDNTIQAAALRGDSDHVSAAA